MYATLHVHKSNLTKILYLIWCSVNIIWGMEMLKELNREEIFTFSNRRPAQSFEKYLKYKNPMRVT